jgi:tetratricopeptide (TPR) repeat protein
MRWTAFLGGVALGALVVGVLWFLFRPAPSPSASRVPVSPDVPRTSALQELLAKSPRELEGTDVASMNLACAEGLPGSEKLDIPRCLAKLDEWARKVKSETDRHLYRAHDPKYALHYRNSENYLRAEMLIQVLTEDCKVHYNRKRIREVDFKNSKDLFIHGMIDDTNGGTCASMPVLYVAVGRRLGYPLKLVVGKNHVFARWEDPKGGERFNIEVTNGMTSESDDHYRTWPEKVTPKEEKDCRLLVSLSPAEELALFLASRAHCLFDLGRFSEARGAYAQACWLDPENMSHRGWVSEAARMEAGMTRHSSEKAERQEASKSGLASNGEEEP